MIGFRKEINREQNLEVIPRGNGDGTVDLLVEVWDGLGPVVLEQWPLPTASFGGSSIPEPGDIIRVRWTQANANALEVRASYFDASAGTWTVDAIAGVYNVSNVNGVDFNDGFHGASSVTIDSPFYSIRRYQVGTLATYPGAECSVTSSPTSVLVPAAGATGSLEITAHPSCAWSATASATWISLTGATTGTGSGAVDYGVAANATSVERSGTVTIGGQVVPFVQAGTPGGTPVLNVADTVVTEESGSVATATFLVILSEPSLAPVSVNFTAGSDSALVGVDVQPAAGTLTFAPGETSKAVAVGVVGDLLDEPAETFTLTLSTPSGATIADGVATGLIFDDDATPTLSVSDAVATEGTATAGSLGFVVSLSAPSGYVVQVNYATASGTAAAGTDFVAAAGTLTFAPGVTSQALPVALVADGFTESTETLQVTLTTPQNAAIADGVGAGSITDDDAPSGPATVILAVASRRRRRQRGDQYAVGHRHDPVRRYRQRQQLRRLALQRRSHPRGRDRDLCPSPGPCLVHAVERHAVRVGGRSQRQRRPVHGQQPSIAARPGSGAGCPLDQRAVGLGDLVHASRRLRRCSRAWSPGPTGPPATAWPWSCVAVAGPGAASSSRPSTAGRPTPRGWSCPTCHRAPRRCRRSASTT